MHVSPVPADLGTVCSESSPNHLESPLGCSSYDTTAPVEQDVLVYVVFVQPDTLGISRIQFGIDYDAAPESGVDVIDWFGCAEAELAALGANGRWPAPMSGLDVYWDPRESCQDQVIGQDGIHVVVGAFLVHAYGPDLLEMALYPQFALPRIVVNFCLGGSDWVLYPDGPTTRTGSIGFGEISVGEALGCNPCREDCDLTPVEDVTWGRLKTRFLAPGSR